MKKKKIVYHSNHCKTKTGFGRNAKALLKYLYSTGKYDIVEYSTGIGWNHPSLSKLPWKCRGTLPENQREWQDIQKNPPLARSVQYGSKFIDRIIKEERPDVYIGVEDIWAFNGYFDRKWWNKINCVIHTTLDSEPILPLAVDAANKINNYYVWANFAKREMHKLGHTHVDVMHGAFDTNDFYRLSDTDRAGLRQKHNLNPNGFIIGFVFRNQLRKSVPQLLDGFKLFLEKNPQAYLLLHTCWHEDPNASWDIPRLMKDRDIDHKRVLTTYVCRSCGEYMIKPFEGEQKNCPYCGKEKSVFTSSPQSGVSENQLNEIYNLMDVYCHPFTSGGQEMPIQEAKLTELVTLVTNYTCGEEHCTEESGGIPLQWEAYFEPGTNFKKATTLPSSICDQLTKVWKMPKDKRSRLGKKAKQYIIKHYDIQKVGKQWEEIIDSLPEITWDYDFTEKKKNPEYTPSNEPDNVKWIQELYENILLIPNIPEHDKGVQDWLQALKDGRSRQDVLAYFKKVASEENQKQNQIEFSALLDKDDEGRRLAIVMPESAGDILMTTSLLQDIKETYPDYNIYFITQSKFMDMLEGNPYIHKVLPYVKECDNLLWLEGQGDHKGFFEIAFLPHIGTQRMLDYLHNDKDKISFNIIKE